MINENCILEMENILSKKVSFNQKDLEMELVNLRKYCEEKSLLVKDLITITYGIRNNEMGIQLLDVEILLNFENKVLEDDFPQGFILKKRVYIYNALNIHYEGPNYESAKIGNELNQYILDKKLSPITSAYFVTHYPYKQKDNIIDLDVYIGINPNIV